MQIRIIAVGRLKRGPDTDLLDRYLSRARQTGRGLGFAGVDVTEVPESKAGETAARKDDEADRILKLIPDDAVLIALDERGKSMPSTAFADTVADVRDDGAKKLAFVIGGPDGLSAKVRRRADRTLSFGEMTLPHGLVRIVLAEQIYRAMTILAGHPYHRA